MASRFHLRVVFFETARGTGRAPVSADLKSRFISSSYFSNILVMDDEDNQDNANLGPVVVCFMTALMLS